MYCFAVESSIVKWTHIKIWIIPTLHYSNFCFQFVRSNCRFASTNSKHSKIVPEKLIQQWFFASTYWIQIERNFPWIIYTRLSPTFQKETCKIITTTLNELRILGSADLISKQQGSTPIVTINETSLVKARGGTHTCHYRITHQMIPETQTKWSRTLKSTYANC